MTVTLNWLDLRSIKEIENTDKKSGVYLWGFSFGNGFIPYYVGIADNIQYRIQQHIAALLSGQYTIYHKDSLAEFHNHKNNKEITPNSGKVYHPEWPNNYGKFLNARKDLQTHIDFMLEKMVFSYALTPDYSAQHQVLKNIEKHCIGVLGKDKLSNTRMGISVEIEIQHTGSNELVQLLNYQRNSGLS